MSYNEHECNMVLFESGEAVAVCTQERGSEHSHDLDPQAAIMRGLARKFSHMDDTVYAYPRVRSYLVVGILGDTGQRFAATYEAHTAEEAETDAVKEQPTLQVSASIVLTDQGGVEVAR